MLDELLAISTRLLAITERAEQPEVKQALGSLEEAANDVGRAWSGSWIGYQSRVYYDGLKPPPPGAHFSQEWGLMGGMSILGTTGDWREFNGEDVDAAIRSLAGNPNLQGVSGVREAAVEVFQECKNEVLSILATVIPERDDAFLVQKKEEVENLSLLTHSAVIRGLQPRGNLISRDSVAVTSGMAIPPHIAVIAEVVSLRQPPGACKKLANIARQVASHIQRRRQLVPANRNVRCAIFIGHGRSPLWRELKDFVQDRLALPWEEFNRVPVAGVANVARLEEMLDTAAIAFLVMTGEDELTSGQMHARLNVVHEAGLFQGRLGFSKAIVLLEEGCEEFGNIHGLGQIHFPKGDIKSAFEEVRRVLEREGLIRI